MNTELRVLVVDDHPVVRRGLLALLHAQPWVAEIAEAQSAAEAIKVAVSWKAHLVIMDIRLPDGDGVEATRRILQARPDVRVLMLTMTDDEDTVTRALRAGACGYVHKDTTPDLLIDALRTVAGGGVVLGPTIGKQILTTLRRTPAELPPPLNKLSQREREILVRLAAGDDNSRIARGIGVSDKTIRNQLSVIYAKLGVTDRLQAALLARDAGLTYPHDR